MRIRLPNNWIPRDYQRKLWKYLESGGDRAFAMWHRRSGKDDVCLHWAAVSAMQRVGTYWHMLPEATQARKAIWEAINPHTGIRRIDEAFPLSIRKSTRENEMFIKFINGSTWQVVGSDNFNSLVGSPPIGVVFSEFALADPQSWSYLRPILLENKGWALFITTPRGKNHAAQMFNSALEDENWFAEKLGIDDTKIFDHDLIVREKNEYIREFGGIEGLLRFRQEYYCDEDAGFPGSYFSEEFRKIEEEKRILNLPIESCVEVNTVWDLGRNDSTSIWFYQVVGKEVRVIDYYENNSIGLDHYAQVLKDKHYLYGTHYLPHDVEITELTTDKSRRNTLINCGVSPITVIPASDVNDGINEARKILSRCWFDKTRCSRGLDCLRAYRRKYNDKMKVFDNSPLHDWSSHAADAFRYLALSFNEDTKHKPIVINKKWIV